MANKQRVTVVNDHPEFLALMADFLGEEGYDVHTLPKHQGAFEQIKQTHPDIVILDMMFDGISAGWALIDMLVLDPETRPIPMVVCSAATNYMQEVAPSLSAKGIPWLEKPFELDDLLRVVHETLSDQDLKHKRNPKGGS
jgi:CheY-like chemotaxis protein